MQTITIVNSAGGVRYEASHSDPKALLLSVPEGCFGIPGRAPTAPSLWSFDRKEWMALLPSLDALREKKWTAIKALRERAEFSTFEWDGSVFQADERSQARLQLALSEALRVGDTFTVEWTLADNTTRVLSAADVASALGALGAHTLGVHARARELRALIDAALNESELDAIQW